MVIGLSGVQFGMLITTSDDRAAGVRFLYHEYGYRQHEVLSPIKYKIAIPKKEEQPSYEIKGKFALKH